MHFDLTMHFSLNKIQICSGRLVCYEILFLLIEVLSFILSVIDVIKYFYAMYILEWNCMSNLKSIRICSQLTLPKINKGDENLGAKVDVCSESRTGLWSEEGHPEIWLLHGKEKFGMWQIYPGCQSVFYFLREVKQ